MAAEIEIRPGMNGAFMNTEVRALKLQTLAGMRDYMVLVLKAGHDPGYSETEIQKCDLILERLVQTLSNSAQGDEREVTAAVREAVMALNVLNAETAGALIEPDQREDICSLIALLAKSRGVGDGEADMTEQWREW